MPVCELCGDALGDQPVLVPCEAFKQAVLAGLRPPAAQLRVVAAETEVSPEEVGGVWAAGILEGWKDWILCSDCGSLVERRRHAGETKTDSSLPPMTWLEQQFLGSQELVMIWGALILVWPLGMLAAIIGMMACKYPKARQNAWYVFLGGMILAGILLAILLGAWVWRALFGGG